MLLVRALGRGSTMEIRETVETALGNFIVVVPEETARRMHDEKEIYQAVVSILEDLLCEEPVSKSWH